ncbi:TetR/AcrR family transcriptional regulator [Brevibacillus sp. SYSU BS000544]|uniref:TetR/AcrR family transcriptional regulator n=1 Tax=Brevibacillus sp. SYSU BS000544 TaxID=3416443 RepID=UPI003CE591EC
MTLSSKEKIKKAALSLFAQKGYYGTSMNDIAVAVGLNKATIYSHYLGKTELFYAVYEDLAFDYEKLNERLFDESKEMKPEERMRYIFEGYILYYYRNKEIQSFWSQMILFTPPELRDKFRADIIARDQHFQSKMEGIFAEAMEQGIIRRDLPIKMVVAFRSMREGLLTWMRVIPEIKEEMIHAFWNELWFGLQIRE